MSFFNHSGLGISKSIYLQNNFVLSQNINKAFGRTIIPLRSNESTHTLIVSGFDNVERFVAKSVDCQGAITEAILSDPVQLATYLYNEFEANLTATDDRLFAIYEITAMMTVVDSTQAPEIKCSVNGIFGPTNLVVTC